MTRKEFEGIEEGKNAKCDSTRTKDVYCTPMFEMICLNEKYRKGISVDALGNMLSGDFYDYGPVYREENDTKKKPCNGLYLNFCPWCGVSYSPWKERKVWVYNIHNSKATGPKPTEPKVAEEASK